MQLAKGSYLLVLQATTKELPKRGVLRQLHLSLSKLGGKGGC
jgi:hypothetical protein